jgi:hypothetical protein
LSCDHSKEKEKKTHHGWIQCGDFHCQHHKGGSITAASHHHHLKTQDPRSKTHFRSSQKQQRQDSWSVFLSEIFFIRRSWLSFFLTFSSRKEIGGGGGKKKSKTERKKKGGAT